MRIFGVLLTALLSAPAGLAQSNDIISTEAVYNCTLIEDNNQRLACYDEAVGRLKTAEEAGEVTTVSRAEVEAVQRDAFGFSLPSLPSLAMPKFGSRDKEDTELAEVNVLVKSIKESRVNGLTVTLENGQVWRQTDQRKVVYSKRKGVEEATIKRAALGSFMMKLDGGVAFRVKRLQ